MVIRLSALHTGRPYPQEMLLVLISVRGHIAIGGILCEWRIPVTPAWIEPATFRFVAQHLNHCATAVPFILRKYQNFFLRYILLLWFFRSLLLQYWPFLSQYHRAVGNNIVQSVINKKSKFNETNILLTPSLEFLTWNFNWVDKFNIVNFPYNCFTHTNKILLIESNKTQVYLFAPLTRVLHVATSSHTIIRHVNTKIS